MPEGRLGVCEATLWPGPGTPSCWLISGGKHPPFGCGQVDALGDRWDLCAHLSFECNMWGGREPGSPGSCEACVAVAGGAASSRLGPAERRPRGGCECPTSLALPSTCRLSPRASHPCHLQGLLLRGRESRRRAACPCGTGSRLCKTEAFPTWRAVLPPAPASASPSVGATERRPPPLTVIDISIQPRQCCQPLKEKPARLSVTVHASSMPGNEFPPDRDTLFRPQLISSMRHGSVLGERRSGGCPDRQMPRA